MFWPCMTPPINRLLVICNYKNAAVGRAQKMNEGVLHGIGILKLIDEDVLKLRAVIRQNLVMRMKQVMREKDEVVKINQSIFL